MRKLRDETVLKTEGFVRVRDDNYELRLWGGAIVIGIVRNSGVWSFHVHGIADEITYREYPPHKTSGEEFASNRVWPCRGNGFSHVANAIIAAKDFINEDDSRGLDLEPD